MTPARHRSGPSALQEVGSSSGQPGKPAARGLAVLPTWCCSTRRRVSRPAEVPNPFLTAVVALPLTLALIHRILQIDLRAQYLLVAGCQRLVLAGDAARQAYCTALMVLVNSRTGWY